MFFCKLDAYWVRAFFFIPWYSGGHSSVAVTSKKKSATFSIIYRSMIMALTILEQLVALRVPLLQELLERSAGVADVTSQAGRESAVKTAFRDLIATPGHPLGNYFLLWDVDGSDMMQITEPNRQALLGHVVASLLPPQIPIINLSADIPVEALDALVLGGISLFDDTSGAIVLRDHPLTAEFDNRGLSSILAQVILRNSQDQPQPLVELLHEAIRNAAIWGNRNQPGNMVTIRWRPTRGSWKAVEVDIIDEGTKPIDFEAQQKAPEGVHSGLFGKRQGFSLHILPHIKLNKFQNGGHYDNPVVTSAGSQVGQAVSVIYPHPTPGY